MTVGAQRKLTVIVVADVVGYSRLMERDALGTRDRMRAIRTELIDPALSEYDGRIVKTMGDAFLMEFQSVVNALTSSIDVQHAMVVREAERPEDQRIQFRVGINLGEVLIEDEDIHGDGVNVAARLEALADPGGILISGRVYEQLDGDLDVGFEAAGEQLVKNIARPVHTYRVLLDPADADIRPAVPVPKRKALPLWPILAGFLLLLAVVAGAGLWWWQPWVERRAPVSPGHAALPLPDKPSIAVLPFTNMSSGKEQEYFADGMAEDLITDLSKISGLFVIARNSSFVYKGRQINVRRVAAELGVRYVLEGSVRRSGNQVRINVQLIDSTTGGHIWAERYDGAMDDVFKLQDKVTKEIITALAIKLTPGEAAIGVNRNTRNPKAHDAFLRGWSHYIRSSPENFAEAIPHFERAVALDPEYGRAFAALASIYLTANSRAWSPSLGMTPDDALEIGLSYLRTALRNPTPLAHQVMSAYATDRGDYDLALKEAERAITLNPNDPDGLSAKGHALILAGRAAEGETLLRHAMRLNPSYPVEYLFYLGMGQYFQGRDADAVATLESAKDLSPRHRGVLTFIVAAYGQSKQAKKAQPLIKRLRVLAKITAFSYSMATTNVMEANMWNPKEPRDLARLRDGLRKSGLPEFPEEWDLKRSDRLTGAEIKAVSFGRTQTGRHSKSGLKFKITRQADGRFSATGLWNDTGTSRVVGSRLCKQWTKYGETCVVIYRNPKGAKATDDDYLLVQNSYQRAL